jgi:hypothetical protein
VDASDHVGSTVVSDGGLVVEIQTASTRFDPTDERWHEQVAQLHRDLLATVPGTRRIEVTQPGTKGWAESILIVLGAVGVIPALVTCFTAWLDRDRSRSLEATWIVDGKPGSFKASGTAVSQAQLDTLAEAVARAITDRTGH